ncbi:MAG: hypothetical protein K2P84_04000 [Undibacterium sp.]|nr:hypothetical protein [Undibacterium sp.]
MSYTMILTFSVDAGSAPLNAQLRITDTSTFSIQTDPVQVQPYNTATTPTLTSLSVGSKNVSVIVGQSGAAALQVLASVTPIGSTMPVNLSYNDVVLTATYGFAGHNGSFPLVYGANTIYFPT